MEKCKWDLSVLGHYIRLTEQNKFIILGNRDGQWKEIFSLQF